MTTARRPVRVLNKPERCEAMTWGASGQCIRTGPPLPFEGARSIAFCRGHAELAAAHVVNLYDGTRLVPLRGGTFRLEDRSFV